MNDLSLLSKQLDQKRTEAENQIRVSFQSLHDVLNQRQTELMNTLNNVVSQKKSSIGINEIQSLKNPFISCFLFKMVKNKNSANGSREWKADANS